jgi:hypothetical protein
MAAKRNQVVRIGPWVLKRLRGPRASQRFWSERETRRMLAGRRIEAIPILVATQAFHTILLPWRKMAHVTNGETPYRFAEHTLHLSSALEIGGFRRFGWLDRPSRMVTMDSFGQFLRKETERYLRRFGSSLLGGSEPEWIFGAFGCIPASGPVVISLTDLSLKNSFEIPGGFCHYDFEATLLAPRDAFLAKVALNLLRDAPENQRGVATQASQMLLARCDARMARAVLAFSLLRMAVYAKVFGGATINPIDSLRALQEGASAADALLEMRHV